MKFVKFAAAAAVAVSASVASAGGLAPAVDESEPMEIKPMMEPKGSLGGWIVPVIALAIIAAAAASSSDSDTSGTASD